MRAHIGAAPSVNLGSGRNLAYERLIKRRFVPMEIGRHAVMSYVLHGTYLLYFSSDVLH